MYFVYEVKCKYDVIISDWNSFVRILLIVFFYIDFESRDRVFLIDLWGFGLFILNIIEFIFFLNLVYEFLVVSFIEYMFNFWFIKVFYYYWKFGVLVSKCGRVICFWWY